MTDDYGIIPQVTAYYLGKSTISHHYTALILCSGRNIHIIGTANAGHQQLYTKLEGGEGAENHQPIIIGFYQTLKHFVSLEREIQ